jgi:hypothetical protein
MRVQRVEKDTPYPPVINKYNPVLEITYYELIIICKK